MTVTQAIAGRRSIRKFKTGAPVSEEQVKTLLTAAMMAPSAHNARPWEFIVVENRAKLGELQACHPYASMLASASLAIVICGAPDRMDTGFWFQDSGAAAENLLLQALDLGLGCCWCGLDPETDRSADVKKIIAAKGVPCALIAVGVPDESPEARGYYDEAKVTWIR